MYNKNRKLKILVIMLYWYPYEGPLMPIYGSVFKVLLKKGHQVTIVTSFPHFRKGRAETWPQYRGKLFKKTLWQGARLIHTYVFAPVFDQTAPGLFYRALNFISFNISSIVAAIFLAGKADVILAPSSPPLTNGICAWIVSRFKKCPVIYNIQDMYPDMAIKMGLITSKKAIDLLRCVEKSVYTICTKVLTISSGMAKILIDKGVPEKKIATIENFIDPDIITPMPHKNEFSYKHDFADKYVVMYAGNIGIPHGVEVLVKAAELLKEKKGICFCFVVRGEKKSFVESMAIEYKLRNTLFLQPQPQEIVPFIWASASVGIITYRKGLSDFSIPSKLLAILCAARPVIASLDEESQTAGIIKDAQCGIVVPPENQEAIAKAIIRLKNESAYAQQLGRNGRKYVKRYFQKDVITTKYEKLFMELVQERRKYKQ